MAAVDHGYSRSDKQTARSADIQKAWRFSSAGHLLDRIDEVLRNRDEFTNSLWGKRRSIGTDDRICSCDCSSDLGGGVNRSLLDREIRLSGKFGRRANYRRYLVAT